MPDAYRYRDELIGSKTIGWFTDGDAVLYGLHPEEPYQNTIHLVPHQLRALEVALCKILADTDTSHTLSLGENCVDDEASIEYDADRGDAVLTREEAAGDALLRLTGDELEQLYAHLKSTIP